MTTGRRAAKTVIPGKELRNSSSWKNARVKDGGGFAGLLDFCVVFLFPGIEMSVVTPTVMNPVPAHFTVFPSSAPFIPLVWRKYEAIAHAAAPDEKPRGPMAVLAGDSTARLSWIQTTTARYVHPTPIPPAVKDKRIPLKDSDARKWPAMVTARPQRMVPAAVTDRPPLRSITEVHVATPIERPIVATAKGTKDQARGMLSNLCSSA